MRRGKNEDSRVWADVRSTHPATPLLPNDNLATVKQDDDSYGYYNLY